jgi:hypothetical protein
MKTGSKRDMSGYTERLPNIRVIEPIQKSLVLPLGFNGRRFFGGIGVLALLFQSIIAGIPIDSEIDAKIASDVENPMYAMLSPANAPPAAVASQIMALFFVASFPAFCGDSW